MAAMKSMKSVGKYGGLGFELLASIAVGYYVGVWADKKLGTRFLAAVGFLVGCYAGFRALYRAAKQMSRDIENDERLARGEDPWRKRAPDEDDADDADDEKEDERADPK